MALGIVKSIQGQIISYSFYLSINITKLYQQLATCPSPSLLKRVELQTEFDLITTNDAERLLLRSRVTYYEHGDKASQLLAHQLRRQVASRMIPQVRDSSGILHKGPTTINSVFHSFYSSLYKSESPLRTLISL